jgi:glycosyltransferase involved in cell wall biosynthesis
MRIAQVSPLYESVPPKLYGGTERIVSYITEEFVRQGHEVTLFASGDSVTNAKLISPCKKALRLDISCADQIAPHFTMLEMLYKKIDDFDVIHYHIDYLHYPISRRYNNVPSITTLHGRLDTTEILDLYKEYKDIPLISISNDQRKPLPDVNWQKTIYHGLPIDQYKEYDGEGKYLAFIGRIAKEKRPDRAIEIAKKAGIPLKIAAKVGKADEEYYHTVIKPMIDGDPLIEFVGEIGEKEKNEFLGNAIAMLFPIDWPEPFGLVMIESMACGTPVIAWKNGSVPEIIDHGITGFVVESIEESVNAIKNISSISRRKVREVFEKRFSSKVMADNYLDLYDDLKNIKPVTEAKYLNF